MDMNRLWPFELRRGASEDPAEGACLLDAVSWFEYGELGDHPKCVSPVLGALARFANDVHETDARQRLKRFIPLLPGTVDEKSDLARTEFIAFAWSKVNQMWRDHIARAGLWRRVDDLGEAMAGGNVSPEAAASYVLHYAIDCLVFARQSRAVRYRSRAVPLSLGLMTPDRLPGAHDAHPIAGANRVQTSACALACSLAKPADRKTTECVTMVADILEFAVTCLDACCAVGRRAPELDVERIPLAVAAFERARVHA